MKMGFIDLVYAFFCPRGARVRSSRVFACLPLHHASHAAQKRRRIAASSNWSEPIQVSVAPMMSSDDHQSKQVDNEEKGVHESDGVCASVVKVSFITAPLAQRVVSITKNMEAALMKRPHKGKFKAGSAPSRAGYPQREARAHVQCPSNAITPLGRGCVGVSARS